MNATIHHGDCLKIMATLPDASVDAIVTDPPYAEIDRKYGRLKESQWHDLMDAVVVECRRLLKPSGSAVFILQPNSERVGRMRPWLFAFMAKWATEWNLVQDAWWWNYTSPPTVHCHRTRGLMRGSLKACVWLGSETCYRDQNAVLWSETQSNIAARNSDRILRKRPSGLTMRNQRCGQAAADRGGVTPFNVLPFCGARAESRKHPAATPVELAKWWVRYICPEEGLVLDPFCGSGTMCVAALSQKRVSIGIEREAEYCEIARARIAAATPPLLPGMETPEP